VPSMPAITMGNMTGRLKGGSRIRISDGVRKKVNREGEDLTLIGIEFQTRR